MPFCPCARVRVLEFYRIKFTLALVAHSYEVHMGCLLRDKGIIFALVSLDNLFITLFDDF